MFGSIIGAIGGIAGSLLNKKSNDKATAANTEAQKNAVSWRVADAKRAGIHPLAALGVPSAGPVASAANVGDGVADAARSFGNMISNREMADLTRQKVEAEIALLQSQRGRNITEAGRALTEQRFINEQIQDSKASRLRQAMNSQQDLTPEPEFIPVRKKDGSVVMRRNPNALIDPEVDMWHWLKGKQEGVDRFLEDRLAPWINRQFGD